MLSNQFAYAANAGMNDRRRTRRTRGIVPDARRIACAEHPAHRAVLAASRLFSGGGAACLRTAVAVAYTRPCAAVVRCREKRRRFAADSVGHA